MQEADAFTRLCTDGGLLDLTADVKLRLSGPDAERYLNGQVSQDVRRIPAGGTLPACVCTHKGKLEALVYIARAADAFFVSASAALRDFLPLRMEKYLIADDAVIEDVTDDFALIHALAPMPAPDGMIFAAARLGTAGTDVWLPRPEAAQLSFSPAEAVETLRIARGIPSWEHELAAGILPPEARLEAACIDYHKGCYTGQEVISRMKTAAKVNRLLHQLTAESRMEPGWEVSGPEGAAGIITSAAWHPVEQRGMALAYLKRSTESCPLTAGPERVVVRVSAAAAV
jgi:tRNA-modifying protein YgfZ